MTDVVISSGKLWAGLGTTAGLLLAGAITVWHERDSRLEADVEQIQMERQLTLEKYVDKTESQRAAIEERTRVYQLLVDRLEAIDSGDD